MINDESIEFNSSNVFTALALFNQLTVPLFIFPITIPIIISSLISTRRIERFLSQPEIEKEFEGVKHMARVLCKSSESLDDDQKSNNGNGTENNHDDVDDDDGGGVDKGKSEGRDNERRKKLQISDKLFRQDTIDEEEMDEQLSTEIKIDDECEEPEIDLMALNNYDNQQSMAAAASENENLTSHNDAVILRHKSNSRVKLKKQNQLSESTRIDRNKLRSTTFVVDKHNNDAIKRTRLPSFKVADGTAVCIKDAKFSWDGGRSEATSKFLEIDNLSIPLGIIIIIYFFLLPRLLFTFSPHSRIKK